MKKRIFAVLVLTLLLLPALCLTSLAANDQLPRGYVTMDKLFEFEKGDGSQPMDYHKVDGFYLVLDHVESYRFANYGDDAVYGIDPPENPYETKSQTLSDKPSVVFTRTENADGFSVSGTWDWKHTFPGGEGSVFEAGEYYTFNSDISLTMTNFSFEIYNVYADIKGHVNYSAGYNGVTKDTGSIDLVGEHVCGYHDFQGKEKTVYLCFPVGQEGAMLGHYNATLVFRIAGVLPKGQKSSGGIFQWASQDAGEDGGVTVPAAIVVGVLGGGAAIAGAAAAASGEGGDDRKKKSYKMYVQKDFGDAIRRGANPVKVRARMAEVDLSTGAERDRNDLTAKISVSGEGMTVHSAALVGRYCEATVSVPEEAADDTAKITFTFTGDGGAFTNTVVFRLIDGPSLKFVEETEEAGAFRLNGSGTSIGVIPGDGFTYTELFMIEDAPVAPKLTDISAENTGEFNVRFELTNRQAVYKMIVKNNTKPEPEHDIFEKPKDENFEIHVIVEGEKEPVKGYVTMKLYPEGITVESRDEGKKNDVKYVRVQAYEKEYVGDLDRKWQVSEMKFTLAVKGREKAIIDPKEAKYTFEKLKGAGGKGTRADKEQSLAEKYEYKESWGILNDKFTYDFEPNTTLAEPDDGTFFLVLLPALCEYDGETYRAEIPLRLRGKPLDPMAAWEKEYKDLTERVEKFALPDNKDYWLKKITELAYDEPKCSVEELRLTSKYLIRQYMRYWTIESMKYRDEAAVYDVIVDYLEWAKFFGDCAFSILVNMYAGPVAEAILSPTKDFLAGAIGETMAAWVRGQSVDVDKFEFSKNVAAAGDNLVSGQISLTSWKQAAATLGCYFAYASIKNFILTLREEDK
ncbi:MAG: hypothetical protein IJU05_09825, partial [Schwartzia sp.]|nr:hypothetical protein [Schwartzia sp. (in: firmicutes)]